MNTVSALRRGGFTGAITVIDADPREPYDKPPLSKQVLAGAWEPERIALTNDEHQDIDWVLGHRATGLDLEARTVTAVGPDGERTIAWDELVIATGAAARQLPGTPDLAGIHVVRTLDDCLGLRADLDAGPSQVAVIGA